MADFAYNNAKNASTDHTPFELNCCYHAQILFVKSRSRSCSDSKLADKLIEICCQNILNSQKL